MQADEVIERLGLAPHPEGGWYRETWRAASEAGQRAGASLIHFLLKTGERSHWHRVDAAEAWLWHAGSPLTLWIAASETGPARPHLLGTELARGARPQVVVPADHWQAAATTGPWTLVSCMVSPAFSFDGFTLADPGFEIPA